MEKRSGFRENLDKATELITQLESGDLNIDQLSELEECTRNLHERSVILRYLAFERKVKPSTISHMDTEPVEDEAQVEEREMSFDIFEAKEPEAEEPFAFEPFAEEKHTREEINETKHIEVESVESETPVEAEKTEESIVEETIEATSEPAESEQAFATLSEGTFLSLLMSPEHSVGSYVGHGKIDSLVGAFGLNERLRFINNLFEGSSDHFADAVKALDGLADLNQAGKTIESIAAKHHWDAEEEVVMEFMHVIRRRYA